MSEEPPKGIFVPLEAPIVIKDTENETKRAHSDDEACSSVGFSKSEEFEALLGDRGMEWLVDMVRKKTKELEETDGVIRQLSNDDSFHPDNFVERNLSQDTFSFLIASRVLSVPFFTACFILCEFARDAVRTNIMMSFQI